MGKTHQSRIHGLVLKVASRCNLNCSYCYVYNQGDHTYRTQPRFMSGEVAQWVLRRAGAYCRRHRIRTFRFVFHGGEPLLAPAPFFREFIALAKRELPPYTQAIYSLQTNGVLLTDGWCQTLGELDIRVGISLDGPPDVHDAYRVDHRGRGSYAATVSGLRRAQRHPALRYHPAVLLVVDPTTDPLAVFDHFAGLSVRVLGLLLPDGTHAKPPPQLPPGTNQTPYADWLIRLFDHWSALPVATRPHIPFFQQLINLILGFGTASSMFGRLANPFLVIETNGSIEAEDSLKVCQSGLTHEGYHLRTHSLDQALSAPLIAACTNSHPTLPDGCLPCPIRDVCGGGFIVHRYHPSSGFNNPSVYCHNLLKLITHLQNRLLATLPPSLLREAGVETLTFEQALRMLERPARNEGVAGLVR